MRSSLGLLALVAPAVCTLLLACSSGGTQTLSVEAVVSDPSKFAGERVRIEGWSAADQSLSDRGIIIVSGDCRPGNDEEGREGCAAFMEDADRIALVTALDPPYANVKAGDQVVLAGTLKITGAGSTTLLVLEDATVVEVK